MSREEVWTARVNDWRSSGERVATWCERHGIGRSQFYYWLRKLSKTEGSGSVAPSAQWVSLHLEEPAVAEQPPILVKIGAAIIEVRPGFEPEVLAGVFKALQGLC